MQKFEYKVIPAPTKGRKGPGIKGAEARFSYGLEQVMNETAADGWEYLRADVLPSEERQGLTSTHTVYRTVLVFRRALDREAMPDAVQQSTETADMAPAAPAPVPLAAARQEPEPPANRPIDPPLTGSEPRFADEIEPPAHARPEFRRIGADHASEPKPDWPTQDTAPDNSKQ